MTAEHAPRPDGRPRFPLPGLAFGLLLIALVHGPLLATPPLFDEGPFLAGISESRGAVLGMQWLPAELALLGSGATAHRVFALALEAALLAIAAASPLVRSSRAPNLALLALGAWLVHPWRTESFLRLGARAELVSEALFLAGFLLAMGARRLGFVALGWLGVAAGASGMPLLLAAAIPLLLAAQGGAARRAAAVALALLAGAAAWWIAAPPPAPLASALAGLDLLVRPWRTGLAHLGADFAPAAAGAGVIALLAAIGAVHKEPPAWWAAVAAALAFVVAPALRPPRTGLELIGAALTPEAWLPALALVLFAAWRLAGRGVASALPLVALAALAVAGGQAHARRFGSESELLEHALAVEPRSVEMRITRAELMLRQAGLAPPGHQREIADATLQAAERVLRERPDDVAAGALKALALALGGHLDAAREQSDRLLARHPDDWRARACRADLESLAGDDLEALPWLRAAVDARPAPYLRAQYFRLLDRIYDEIRLDLAERRWESARRRCERLLAVAPEEIEAREAWIDTFTLAGDLPRALEEAKKLYGERPHDRRIVQRLASLLQRLGEHDEARDYLRRLLALPEEPERPRRGSDAERR